MQNNSDNIVNSLVRNEPCVIAFGVFDGLHTGHKYVLEQAKAKAEELGEDFIVVTFDQDPDELFSPQALSKLMSNQERLCALANYGCSQVLALPFTIEFAKLSPQAFLESVFASLKPSNIFVGENIHFGYRATGDIEFMKSWAQQQTETVTVHALPLQTQTGEPVSSTRIRHLLSLGEISQANDLLGYLYSVDGVVVSGRQNGAEFGFRTANLNLTNCILADGVYAGYAIVDGTRWKAAISLGVSPTFKEATANCEAHILDFQEDIYGKTIQIEFHTFLRPMMKFQSTEELITTVMGNIQTCKEIL